MNTYHLWLHIARIREANGDIEGAARARRSASRLPNRKLRRKFPFDSRCWGCPGKKACENGCKILADQKP